MEDILQLIFDNFFLIWCLAFVWVIGSFTFKHYRNKKKGLYFQEPDSGSIVYSENYASGRSHKSIKTKFGGASNCLKIQLTPSHLYVRPFFPFIILGPHFDLIHEIPVARIKKIEAASGFMASGIDILFMDEEGKDRKITVVSKKSPELTAALFELIKQQAQPVAPHNSG